MNIRLPELLRAELDSSSAAAGVSAAAFAISAIRAALDTRDFQPAPIKRGMKPRKVPPSGPGCMDGGGA